MDFRDMRYVCEIARQQTVSKAAEELFVAQPSLSLYLKKIENELNLKLFDRVNKKMIPTYAGQVYIEYARQILELEQALSLEMKSIVENKKGHLTIGSTNARTHLILRELLPEFHEKYPDYEIDIREGTHDELSDMLDRHIIDLAFFTASSTDDRHTYYDLGNEEIVLCTSRDSKYSNMAVKKEGFRHPWLDLHLLEKEVFLLVPDYWRSGSYGRRWISEADIKPKILNFEHVETAVDLAGSGLGVAFCSEMMITRGVFKNMPDYYSVGTIPSPVKSVLVHRKDYVLTEPVREFIDSAVNTLRVD